MSKRVSKQKRKESSDSSSSSESKDADFKRLAEELEPASKRAKQPEEAEIKNAKQVSDNSHLTVLLDQV
jgi:hypothetical protein